MNGLPNRAIRSKDFLQRWTSQGAIGRHGKCKGQEFVIKAFNDQQVDFVQHRQGGGKDRKCLADSRLDGA